MKNMPNIIDAITAAESEMRYYQEEVSRIPMRLCPIGYPARMTYADLQVLLDVVKKKAGDA